MNETSWVSQKKTHEPNILFWSLLNVVSILSQKNVQLINHSSIFFSPPCKLERNIVVRPRFIADVCVYEEKPRKKMTIV